MLFRRPEPRPGPPRAKKNFLATEKIILLHFAAWRPRRVRKIIFRPRFFLGAQGLRKLKTCFFGVRRLRRHAGSSKRLRRRTKSIFQLLLRRPGAPEAPRTLQKAPAGAKTICGVSENAFLVPGVSLWGPPCQKKFVRRRKKIFWCISQPGGLGRCKKQM